MLTVILLLFVLFVCIAETIAAIALIGVLISEGESLATTVMSGLLVPGTVAVWLTGAYVAEILLSR